MGNLTYDSYCGIYCGACNLRIAHETGQKDNLTAVWTEPVLRAFQEAQGNAGLSGEALRIKCLGCKTDTVFINCKTCQIRSCAIKKKVEHCFECAEYPCATYTGFQKMGSFLPHLKPNQRNLETIKTAGVQTWLGAQDKQWRCPECGTGFGWYTGTCRSCGRKLTGQSYPFSALKAFVLRFTIRLASFAAKKTKKKSKRKI